MDIFYRKKVSAIIVNKKNEFLIVQLVRYSEGDWNFPGGGVEDGETEKEAVVRELYEELGTNKFNVLKKGRGRHKYIWPFRVILYKLLTKKQFHIGQSEIFFLVEFTGKKTDIVFDKMELRAIKWVLKEDLAKYLNFPKQLEVAERQIKYFDK